MSRIQIWEPSIKAVPYSLPAEGLVSSVKIAFLSDLHGEGHTECLAMVREFAPDLVIFGGDTFDERVSLKGGLEALRAFQKEFRTFYIPGNHEIKTGRSDLV
ncbi:MAG: metallophosphoesterase, partial [Clostridia bacterium]|nr:metallophosphoesterase [Clostridia bacterium]